MLKHTKLYTLRGPAGTVLMRHHSLWSVLDKLLQFTHKFPGKSFTIT
jgi:hypothetical protein